jgi:hypothetical protein
MIAAINGNRHQALMASELAGCYYKGFSKYSHAMLEIGMHRLAGRLPRFNE